MSVNIKFPTDPEDGMVFEVVIGVFYKYDTGSNCWTRLKGVDSLGLATPLTDGLMSKEDFTKLQNLILPPPQATLKGEKCETTFKSGTVALYSFDDSVEISKNPKIINKTPQGIVDATAPWQLHRNTAGFDFRISLDRIVQEVEERNQLKKIQLQGDKGAKGKRGDPGRDRLDTGPIGTHGAPGINSPFGGTLVAESIPFELAPGSNNRAVVNVTTENISEDENYLVVTRANIGNPDACPVLITPKDFNSALVVALNTITGGKLIKDQTVTSGDCALICRICASSLHHLNIEDIVDAIFDQFVIRVDQLKLEKENLVKAWLGTMISLFSEQKSALCCALENCRSRQRNERTRQYIETQRIQAALGNFQLLVDGGGEHRQVTGMDADKNCPLPDKCLSSVVIDGNCTLINLDSKIHIADPRVNSAQAVTTFLQAGSYVAEITECCANFNISNPAYSARAGILYQALISVGGGTSQDAQAYTEQSMITFPSFGSFSNESAAKNAYQGVTLTFEHNGGDISFWLIDPDGFSSNNVGSVQITVKPAVTEESTTPEADGFLYVYRDEISFDGLLGRVIPFAGALTASENFGSLNDNVDLTFGPTLTKDSAQVFFYEGLDGLSMFFVAGESSGTNNEQVANILVDTNISNNAFNTAVRANDSSTDIKQLSSSEYQATLAIDANSAGFAIGEFDSSSDYSIRVDPHDLSTMRTFVAADAAGNDIIISEGGSAGIGGDIAATQVNSAPLFGVSDVPISFGGGNTIGIRINNESSGQNVYITRPVDINISAAFGVENTGVGASAVIGASSAGSITSDAGVSEACEEPAAPEPVAAPAPVEEQILVTSTELLKLQDGEFTGWDSVGRTSGRSGSSFSTRRVSSDGNPGAYRESTHSSGVAPRTLARVGRPSKAFFGPGSSGALPWDQSIATDQFGNNWIFIRAVDGRQDDPGAPHRDGTNDVFIRDATPSEIVTFSDLSAQNVFGGPSGIQEGATAQTDSATPANISTLHVARAGEYTPSTSGSLTSMSLNIDIKMLSGVGFDVGMVVFQDGQLYASSDFVSVSQQEWLQVGVGAATASGFGAVNSNGIINTNVNPNFQSGTSIRFGYYLKSVHTSSDPESMVMGIDNWTACLTVESVGSPAVTSTEDGVPASIIEEKGEFIGEEASSLARGATGSPQDPNISDVCISIRSPAPQSIRYILTDKDGVKFYSAYRSIDVSKLNEFQLFSFGPAVIVLAPPVEFTPAVIFGKSIETSVVSSQLTSGQLAIANSLDGIARLSYIQSILGASSSVTPNNRNITDIEIEFRSTPFSSIDVGYISAKVGIPGAITEVVIDNFEVKEVVVGQSEAEPERSVGSIKRVVATNNGSDSSTTGIIYSGIDNYFGDYTGFDHFTKNNVDFHGNNFFLLNRAGDKIVRVTNGRGFNNIQTTPFSGGVNLTSNSKNVNDLDAIAVSDFGVVYMADGPQGEILAFHARNGVLINSTFGDVHDNGANLVVVIATGLPKTDNAILTLGRKIQDGPNMVDEIVANFGGKWFKINGLQTTLWQHTTAVRADVTTPRCCFNDNPPGANRMVAMAGGSGVAVNFANGPSGNSIATSKNANPQPSTPVAGKKINQAVINAINTELDRDFNQFSLYTLDNDTIYEVNQSTGVRSIVRALGESAVGVRVNPRTKDIYYITNDRGTSPPSGTAIRRVDINDLDPDNDNKPRIKTVYNTEGSEGIFGITFGNSVPTDTTTKNQTLYALLSTFEVLDKGNSVTARLVEISELIVPPVLSQPISQEIPLNATWNSHVSGGRLPGNPSRVIFSRVTPGGGCQMHHKQVQWYERGWRIGACCGALVEVNGVFYIVAKRSIGTDTSCGGGESLSNACISQFIDVGEGHPAIAWPTSEPLGSPPGGGGDEFLGIPTSGFVNFVKDESLSSTILSLIQTGNVVRTIGNPASEIPFILFPAA